MSPLPLADVGSSARTEAQTSYTTAWREFAEQVMQPSQNAGRLSDGTVDLISDEETRRLDEFQNLVGARGIVNGCCQRSLVSTGLA